MDRDSRPFACCALNDTGDRFMGGTVRTILFEPLVSEQDRLRRYFRRGVGTSRAASGMAAIASAADRATLRSQHGRIFRPRREDKGRFTIGSGQAGARTAPV